VERQGGAVVFGTRGTSKGLFKRPLGIVINTHDVVYVTNVMLKNTVRTCPNGAVEKVVTGAPISGPIGIETDSYNYIYVSNSQDNKILKINLRRRRL
jgi:DNA-binding beta-propeller fold protein YncE